MGQAGSGGQMIPPSRKKEFMAKTSAKRTAERRKTPRKQAAKAASSSRGTTSARNRATEPKRQTIATEKLADECVQCGKTLGENDRALFVEEELCRTFCSEDCIGDFFAPDIRRLEREYQKHVPTDDLTDSEREKYAHLRWVTLEEPDEAWMEKTVAGDHRFTLISEFRPADKKIWMVCICLYLRGEPSFLFIAFPTASLELVKHFRRGERVRAHKSTRKKAQVTQDSTKSTPEPAQAGGSEGPMIDGLADGWSEDESIRAQLSQRRDPNDIPPAEFELYQGCLEETLEAPDEVWAMEMTDEGKIVERKEHLDEDMDPVETVKVYHFIRRYAQDSPEMWYVIVARETETEDQIELLDAFPTRDPDLVQKHRRGIQEIGQADQAQATRVVH
jgi:hypothetical protein